MTKLLRRIRLSYDRGIARYVYDGLARLYPENWYMHVQTFAYVVAASSDSTSRWNWAYRVADEVYNTGCRWGLIPGDIYLVNGEYPPKKIRLDESVLDDEFGSMMLV